eukprot:3645643-Alexandrium_andersonii.AAC.1
MPPPGRSAGPHVVPLIRGRPNFNRAFFGKQRREQRRLPTVPCSCPGGLAGTAEPALALAST